MSTKCVLLDVLALKPAATTASPHQADKMLQLGFEEQLDAVAKVREGAGTEEPANTSGCMRIPVWFGFLGDFCWLGILAFPIWYLLGNLFHFFAKVLKQIQISH